MEVLYWRGDEGTYSNRNLGIRSESAFLERSSGTLCSLDVEGLGGYEYLWATLKGVAGRCPVLGGKSHNTSFSCLIFPRRVRMDFPTQAIFVAFVLLLVIYYKKLTVFNMAVSGGVGCLLYGLDLPAPVALGAAAVIMLVLVYQIKNGAEGFNTNTPTKDIVATLSRLKKPTIEGYEDVKKEKDEIPAPAVDKDSMAVPFKLGEIPSQVKNGPHIDATSTLVKAINSLNPEQIKAMSKDTQQLIETQKSLMSMLGSMKPMLNDGKELMNTFQDMFGKT